MRTTIDPTTTHAQRHGEWPAALAVLVSARMRAGAARGDERVLDRALGALERVRAETPAADRDGIDRAIALLRAVDRLPGAAEPAGQGLAWAIETLEWLRATGPRRTVRRLHHALDALDDALDRDSGPADRA